MMSAVFQKVFRPAVHRFSPRSIEYLFKNGELGSVYSPINAQTAYATSNGATALSASGDPVGLVLDTRVAPLELVSNGDFSSGTTNGWTAGAAQVLSVVGGALRITRGSQLNQATYTICTTEIGATYKFRFEFVGESAASNEYLDMRVGTTIGGVDLFRVIPLNAGSEGFYGGIFTATSTTTYISPVLRDGASGNWIEIDNVSLQKISPAYLSQSTALDRPEFTGAGVEFAGTESLDATLPDLGTNATVVRASGGILTVQSGQTISGAYTVSDNFDALIIINRPLSKAEVYDLERRLL